MYDGKNINIKQKYLCRRQGFNNSLYDNLNKIYTVID